MIDEKDIRGAIELFTMTEPFSPSEKRLYEAGKCLAAAYREKCEEFETLKTIGYDLCFFLKNRITDIEPDPIIAIRRWKEFIK